MPARKKPIPSVYLRVALPEDLRLRLDLLLFSPLENRVPMGAYSEFLQRLLKAHFEHRDLDLSPYAGTLPGTCVVRASPFTISTLKTLLGDRPHDLPLS